MPIAYLSKYSDLGNLNNDPMPNAVNFSDQVRSVVTQYGYGASNYGEAEYAKVLSAVTPQYEAYFQAQNTAQVQARQLEANLATIQNLVRTNYPNLRNTYVVRAISKQSFGTNKGVFKLVIATDARGQGQEYEFDQNLPPDTVFAQMRTYLSAATGTVPLAAGGNNTNAAAANSVNAATAQTATAATTNNNNTAATTGTIGNNNAAASQNGTFSWIPYGGPSPMTVWTPSGPSSNVTTSGLDSVMNWVKENPLLTVAIGIGGFLAVRSMRGPSLG